MHFRNPTFSVLTKGYAIVIQSDPSRLAIVFDIALSARSNRERERCLHLLALSLPSDLLADVLMFCDRHYNDETKSLIIRSCSNCLPTPLQAGGLGTALRIVDEYHRSVALSALVPHLPSGLQRTAFDAICRLTNEPHRLAAIASIASHLAPELRTEALSQVQAATDVFGRVKALVNIGPTMITKEYNVLYTEIQDACALAVASMIADPVTRARLLGWLLAKIPDNQRSRAYAQFSAAVGAMESARDRALLMAELATSLPMELRTVAWDKAFIYGRSVALENERRVTLFRLASMLPFDLQSHIIENTKAMQSKRRLEMWAALLASHSIYEQVHLEDIDELTVNAIIAEMQLTEIDLPDITNGLIDSFEAVHSKITDPLQQMLALSVLAHYQYRDLWVPMMALLQVIQLTQPNKVARGGSAHSGAARSHQHRLS